MRSFSNLSFSARANSFFLRASSILRCSSSNFFRAFSSSSACFFNSSSLNLTSCSFKRSSLSKAVSSILVFLILLSVTEVSEFFKLKVLTCCLIRPKKEIEVSFSSVESVVSFSTTKSFFSFDIKKILSHTIPFYYIKNYSKII